jgi:hypothetical protein
MNVKNFQEADAELVLRLSYVLDRAQELIVHFPKRYKTESGEQIDPATGWLLEIMVTLASEGADDPAPDDACEIAIDAMFERMQNTTSGVIDDGEAEWMPVQEYIERQRNK